MSGFSGRGLSGNRLYIAILAWFALVIIGATCLYVGYTTSPDGAGEKAAGATQPGIIPPTPEATAVAIQPTPAAATTAEPGGEEVFGYGIAVHGTGGPLELTDYWMGQVQNLGLGWVKQQVRWGFFERNPDEMDWSGYDAVVNAANAKGLKVMLSVVEAPMWTRSYFDDNTEKAPPDDLAKYAEFLGRLVDRYKGRIHAIEVWNEQNLDREWDTAEGINAERYVEMLRLSHEAIKRRDPNIIIISGALAPTGANLFDPANPERRITMDDFDYFDQMIAAGFLSYCDCVGAHHNGYNLPPDKGEDDGYFDPSAQYDSPFTNPHHSWWFKTTLWGYHERIQAAGSDKPLCVTEFGWASTEGLDGYPDVYPEGFKFALDNTQQEQAQWIVQAFQLMREWGFVRLAFLWNLNFSQLNDGRGAADSNAPYGIIDMQGVARPAFDAISAMEKRQ